MGAGRFMANIDVGAEAASQLNNGDGELEFKVYATDASTNVTEKTDPLNQKIAIKNCTQAAAAVSGEKTPPVLSNVSVPLLAYYNGAACGATSATVTASASDNTGQISKVIFRYRYNGGSGATVGDFKEKTMPASGGKYSLNIDVGAEANIVMKGNHGVLEYQIIVTDAAGNSTTYPAGSHPGGIEVKSALLNRVVNKAGNQVGNQLIQTLQLSRK